MPENRGEKPETMRAPYLKNLVLAFILATLLFASAFLFGYTISYYKYQNTIQSQEQFRYNLLSFEIERELVGNDCDNFNPYLFSSEMDNLGGIIGILENRLGKNDPGVLEQKKMYSLLEARHFLYVKEHNSACKNITPTILFFYSNKDNYKDEAERRGAMLTALKKEEKVMIYSFDYDLDSSLISLLKEKYKVTQPNMLVINEQPLINVFRNINDIKDFLD